MTSKNIFVKRQQHLQRRLVCLKVDAYLSDHPKDIFYLTGIELSLGRLLIGKNQAVLFVDGRYEEIAKKMGTAVIKKRGDKTLLSLLLSSSWKEVNVIGFDTQTPYASLNQLKKGLKGFRLKGLERPIEEMRKIKDQKEIELLKKSASLLWEGFLHAKKGLKVGVEEREVALAFEFYCRKQGAEGVSFPPIVAFGPNSALPHHHSGKRRLKEGDVVLMDLGVQLRGYASDMTRTFFFGQGPSYLQHLYKVVAEAKQEALARCRPGTALSELDRAARQVMKKAKMEKNFLHSLGHGIGLDVHELPNFRLEGESLEEGMVITIEPGLYLKGKGGVRLEDMIVITKTGHQNLFDSRESL
jgi:Xaa-Pro aminopeptidase